MTYRLERVSATLHIIRRGKQQVGRVVQHADGDWVAVINRDPPLRRPTAAEAFREVCARAFGFANRHELDQHNAVIRHKRKVARNHARAIAHEYLTATTFEGRMAAIDKIFGGK